MKWNLKQFKDLYVGDTFVYDRRKWTKVSYFEAWSLNQVVDITGWNYVFVGEY